MTRTAQITARRKKLTRTNASTSGTDERHPASILASNGNGIETGVLRSDFLAALSKRFSICSS
jgi:phage replication-related protein YjqB (UPF0714/DUF867 family)